MGAEGDLEGDVQDNLTFATLLTVIPIKKSFLAVDKMLTSTAPHFPRCLPVLLSRSLVLKQAVCEKHVLSFVLHLPLYITQHLLLL